LAFIALYKLFLGFAYNTAVPSSEQKGPDSAGLWDPLTFLLAHVLEHICIRTYSHLLSKLFLKSLGTFEQANCSKFGIRRGCLSGTSIDNVSIYKKTNLKALEKQVKSKTG